MVSDSALSLKIMKIQGGGGVPLTAPPLNTPLKTTISSILFRGTHDALDFREDIWNGHFIFPQKEHGVKYIFQNPLPKNKNNKILQLLLNIGPV